MNFYSLSNRGRGFKFRLASPCFWELMSKIQNEFYCIFWMKQCIHFYHKKQKTKIIRKSFLTLVTVTIPMFTELVSPKFRSPFFVSAHTDPWRAWNVKCRTPAVDTKWLIIFTWALQPICDPKCNRQIGNTYESQW